MSSDLEAKLAQLKKLHEMGLLTDADLQRQKDAALAAYMGTTPAAPASPLSGATRVETSTAPAPPATDLLSGATTADPSAGLPARLGSYRVLGVIGAGGMGTVVRARHDSDGWARRQGGDVALKLIHPHIAADPAFQERFLDEAELGRRIQHPGLARVYDVVTEGPWLGTVLELIEGRELSDWVRPGGLPVDEVLSLLTPLAEALDHLHGQGIVHRDLKPANVKVRPDGRPALLDLGIAKDLSGESGGQTKTMTTMGTSAWMAPEQADAKSVTAAADVYAFGLLAYALLSGRMPWGEGESELRVLTNKMMGKLAPLSSVKPELPEAVSAAVMVALSVSPDGRPASCGALVQALGGAGASARREAVQKPSRAGLAESARQVPPHRATPKPGQPGPHPHTHTYVGPVVESTVAERTRDVVESQGFLGFGRQVREETYEAQIDRVVERRHQQRAAERFELEGESFVLVDVPSGFRTVGSLDGEASEDECPQHSVHLTQGFRVSIHPVTQQLWQTVMKKNPSTFKNSNDLGRRPVERVSWFDAVNFCNRLSERCGLRSAYQIVGSDVQVDPSAPGFRLPTEHEWEVAARAGTELRYAGSQETGSVAWTKENAGSESHPVGDKAPNGWGLYDMSGQLWEWCWDWYDKDAYQSGTMTDPQGPRSGQHRVARGGAWSSAHERARVGYRNRDEPSRRSHSVGFRLVRTLS